MTGGWTMLVAKDGNTAPPTIPFVRKKGNVDA